MKVLITGSNGQLARDLIDNSPENFDIHPMTRSELDITDAKKVNNVIDRVKPDIVINTAAYTAVDECEINKDTAWEVNCTGTGNLVSAIINSDTKLVHYSTDYVFGGSANRPYRVDDETRPLSVYGKSKLAGEKLIREKLNKENAIIIRSGWIYSAHSTNFFKKIMQLMKSRPAISVINDQTGTPTWSKSLALASWKLIAKGNDRIIYHYSDGGYCTWYDFAVQIYKELVNRKIINHKVDITPVSSKEFNALAQRPHYSVLDSQLLQDEIEYIPDSWEVSLNKMLDLYPELASS